MRAFLPCSVATFVLAYTNLLQVHSGFTVEVAQSVLDARRGAGPLEVQKKDAKDAINQCKEVGPALSSLPIVQHFATFHVRVHTKIGVCNDMLL